MKKKAEFIWKFLHNAINLGSDRTEISVDFLFGFDTFILLGLHKYMTL